LGGYDPLELAAQVSRLVVRGELRRYYRVARAGRWYGGVATADCTGCNLRCVFCWSGVPRDNPEIGSFYSPEQVFNALHQIALKRGYRLLRVSGNEPTIGWSHLIRLLELVEGSPHHFILETNGILIGSNRQYARELSRFSRVHVRVSLKGATPEEFHRLTGARAESFELQLRALQNLLDFGVSCHPAVMLSFTSRNSLERLMERLRGIDKRLVEGLEGEYVILYPHVKERLRRAGIWPKIAYNPP